MQQVANTLFFVLFLFNAGIIYANKLVYSTDIIRHGARTTIYPIKGIRYPAVWSKDNVPSGQLTMYGFQEAMFFGQSVRQLCEREKCNFLSSFYSPERICIRTTGINRTVMTAEAALTSIYPSISQVLNNNTYIKLYPVPGTKDNMLLQKNSYHTPALDDAVAWKKQWQSASGYFFYKTLQRINPNFFPEGICSFNSNNRKYKYCLAAIVPLADNVQTLRDYCQADHLCNVKKILHLTQQQQNKVLDASAWYIIHALLPNNTFSKYRVDYKKIGIARGSRIVSEIAKNLSSVIQNGKQHYPYVLYSGHESTLFGVLGYLLSLMPDGSVNNVINNYPGFVSAIRFLLYQNANNHFIVKIIYFSNALKAKENKGIVILEEPFDRFYKTYYIEKEYKTIYSKSSCDYTFSGKAFR